MFQGHVTPRPFPLVRYRNELSTEQTVDGFYEHGLLAGPSALFSFFGDWAVDLLFSPIDLVMSCWAKEPEVRVLPLEDGNPNGPYRLELYAATSEMHCPDSPDGKEGPVVIDVRQGALSFWMNYGAVDRKCLIEITPEKQGELLMNAQPWGMPESELLDGSAKLDLYMAVSAVEWEPFGLTRGVTGDKNRSLGCRLLRTYTDRRSGRPRSERWTPWNRIHVKPEDDSGLQRITLVPSHDFVGSYTYEGKTISEIWFFRRPDWPSSEE